MIVREPLWQQFGAAIDMLGNAIRACPDELWDRAGDDPAIWYIAYHTIFWLDYYSSGAPADFDPAAPVGLSEFDSDGDVPTNAIPRGELLTYLADIRARLRNLILNLTDERAAENLAMRWGSMSVLELLIYNLRHVQHHTGQLNLLLRQRANDAPAWVKQAEPPGRASES